ncbi:MAG TPA: rRNA adenine N-6-methyltransferase family protein [Longimicrobiales bacterium]|nr:rRNA adenine N-6-methyltransferase family protein [Longimicrobiales bacterium]
MSSPTPVHSKRRLFARNFFKHPRMLGSLIPSSRFLVDQILEQVDWNRARTIVEYGPGVGTITGEILRRMHREARLVALETNPDFVQYLRQHYPRERFSVEARSAAEVRNVLQERRLPGADVVISGIPFSTLPPGVMDEVLRATHDALLPGGRFIVYQFSGKVLPHLEEYFGEVRTDFELLNILPARLFYATR